MYHGKQSAKGMSRRNGGARAESPQAWRGRRGPAASLAGALGAAVLALGAQTANAPAANAQTAHATPDLVTMKYGERRAYFSDWLASCRPGGYCSALAYVGARGDFYDYAIRVGSPAPGLDYEILLTAVETFLSETATISVAIDRIYDDSFAAGADLGWHREPGDAVNEHRFAQSPANLALLPAMKRGYRMRVRWTDADGGAQAQTFSLIGLRAALSWIEANRMP